MSENEQRRDGDEIDPHAATPADADGTHPSGEDDDDEADQLVLSPPDAAAAPRDFALWAGVLFLAALTAYGPALRGQFLWDDDRHVTQNTALRTFDGLGAIWLTPGTTPQYYPLTHTTYWFEYQFLARGADGELNPLVFHVTNVLLHAGAATLLWFILRRLRVPGAWVAAAVFALHPINVESVAWISERKNVLSAALMFGSILAYLKFAGVGGEEGSGLVQGSGNAEGVRRSPGRRPEDAADDATSPNWDTYFIALGLFLAAMLSKTVACSAPAVLLVLLWWQRRLDRRHVLLLVPFFVLGLALAGVTVWMEQSHVIGAHAAEGDWDLTIAQRVVIAGRAICFYLRKLLVPIGLAFIYPRWDVNPADPVQWVYPLSVIAALAALWALRGRIGRGPLAAALIYVGVLVPALGFINIYPMRYSFVANHFQYHASAAAIAAIVAGVVVVLRRTLGVAAEPAPASPAAAAPGASDADATRVSPTPYIIAGALLLVLVVLTWRLAGTYDNPVSLFEDTIAKNPGAWMAYHNLGTTLMNSGNVYATAGNEEQAKALREEAVERLRQAIKLRPQHVSARNNLGIVLMALGHIPEALASFREAVARDPDHVDALANIGVALDRLDQPEQALAAFEVALATCQAQRPPRPEQCATIRQYIGRILARQGEVEAALAQYRAAARERPDDLSLQHEYGALLARHGDKVTAAGVFAAILRRDPQHLDARLGLARLLWEVGRILEAREQLEIAAKIDPNSPRLLQAIIDWDQAYRAATQAAATQAAATQATTTPSATTQAATTAAAMRTFSNPTTQPSKAHWP